MCPAASKADVHVVGTNRHAAMRRHGGTGEDGAAPREQCERRARREPGKLPSQQTAAALDTNSVQADRIRADSHFNKTPADHRGSPPGLRNDLLYHLPLQQSPGRSPGETSIGRR